ncbi:AraC family transcriptional regulator [Sphingobacterium corticibacter]|uniref:AraC family transcriptional regulator n=2 Tax=Sphingobacterium corticibacter TaxID=2171749 RepID=A0A2T8HP43_9SPHI|nr:AraC family transcriptional regulator [Sphingobacterium corticibacter]
MQRLQLKQQVLKKEDVEISFRVFDLDSKQLNDYLQPHQKDFFCIFLVEEGELKLHIEDRILTLHSGQISVIFPNQVHFVQSRSTSLSGKIILFEEVLFCSDILKNELSPYNVNLTTQLSNVFLLKAEFDEAVHLIALIQRIYENPSLVRKEQARFYIKIFLLKLIESVHGQHPVLGKKTPDQLLYVEFKRLLNENYKEERSVRYYADRLAITPKKLNLITKKHCKETAINAIHNRILTEIKRQFMFAHISHKEIALDLGFNSPAAFNKFVKAKLNETPTQLQQELAQMYNT